MTKLAHKADANRGGFIRTTLAPVNSKDHSRFGTFEAVLLLALAVASGAAMRLLLAH
jgi:hypothetical protein